MSDGLNKFQAVHFRHHEIGDDKIGHMTLKLLQRVPTVARVENRDLQPLFQQPTSQFAVEH